MAAPSLEITIGSNASSLTRAWADFRRSQMPFAVAKTLTELAAGGSDAVRAGMPKTFTIREPRVVKGILGTRAEKRDWPHPFSEVGSLDAFMAIHATGGTKRPERSRALAIPGREAKVRTKKGKIRASSKPRALLHGSTAKKKPFLVTFKSGKRAIVRRKGKKRTPLLILYHLEFVAEIPDRWKFSEEVAHLVQKDYDSTLQRNLRAAVAKSRRKIRRPRA